MKKELISIIIPVYNVEPYLVQCLDSVVKQCFENIEVIIVNDGSTDNSLKICEHYAEKYSNIKLINQKNQGLGAARNTGIIASNGEYIAFLDSDDYIRSDFCSILYEAVKNSGCLLAGCRAIRVSEKGTHIDRAEKLFEGAKNLSIEEAILGIYTGGRIPQFYVDTGWGKLYHRSLVVKRNGYFPTGVYFEDCVPAIESFISANGICLVSDALLFYRKRIGSIMEFMPFRPEALRQHFVQNADAMVVVADCKAISVKAKKAYYNKMRIRVCREYNRYQLQIYEAKVLCEEFDFTKKYALFGAGQHADKYLNHILSGFKTDRLVLIDNNPALIGTSIKGVRVISLDEYNRNYTDHELIITSTYCNEMIYQLLQTRTISEIAEVLPNKGQTSFEKAISEGMEYFIDMTRRTGILENWQEI